MVWGLALLLGATALVQDERLLVHLRQTWWNIPPPAAVALATGLADAPASSEVISSNGVIGRFSQRRYLYPLQLSPQTIPVKTSHVVFVTATAGNEALTARVPSRIVETFWDKQAKQKKRRLLSPREPSRWLADWLLRVQAVEGIEG